MFALQLIAKIILGKAGVNKKSYLRMKIVFTDESHILEF